MAQLWNVGTGGRTEVGSALSATAAALPASKETVVIGTSNGEVTVHDTKSGEARRLGSFTWPVMSLSVSGDGRYVAAGAQDGAISLFDTGASRTGGTVAVPGTWKPADVVFSGPLAVRANGQTTEFWSLGAAGAPPRRQAVLPRAFDSYTSAISVSGDGRRAVFYDGGPGTLSLWDLRSEKMISRAPKLRGFDRMMQPTFLADGRHAVAVAKEGLVIMDTQDWTAAPLEPGDFFDVLAVSADARTVVTKDGDSVTIWRWRDDDLVRVRDVGFESTTTDVTLSQDGESVALVDRDGHLFVIDVATGDVATSGRVVGGGPEAIVYSGDGRVIVQLADFDGDVAMQFWDTRTADHLGGWTFGPIGDETFESDLAVTPDEKILAIADDGRLRVREVGVQAWRTTLCAVLDDPRPAAEYRRYLDGLSVEDPCPR